MDKLPDFYTGLGSSNLPEGTCISVREPPCFLDGGICARMGGMGQAHSGSASGISARASRATDERRRSIAMQKFSSGSDTTKALLKTWRGVVRGRTPKARSSERYTLDEPQNRHGTEDSK